MTAASIPAARPARRGVMAAVAALVCALGLVLTAAVPAQAYGMKMIAGNISCTAFPNTSVGTSAVAKGTVAFQLNQVNNTGTLYFQTMGYSSNYTNWSWKFWTMQSGNYYAYGQGSNGAVSSLDRWCHNIGG